MATLEPRDRLQPALLDRLIDEEPAVRQDPEGTGLVIGKARLRQAVLRDLGWLLNAVQPLSTAEAREHPAVASSVLNFGLPPLSGALASRVDVTELERVLREALLRFEPRLLADTLQVRAVETESVMDTHNMMEFSIYGHLWAQPVPLEILLRARLNLEAGQVEVLDGAPSAPAGMRTR